MKPLRFHLQPCTAHRFLGALLVCLLSLCGAAPTLAAETLRVGGTGSSAPLAAQLFAAFRRHAPDAELVQTAPPLGSGGAMRALAAGAIDIALIGRPPTPAESARVGRSFVLAATPFVLASQGGRRAAGFSRDELAAVYEGRLRHWDEGKPIRLVLRASMESDTLTLKSLSPAMAAAVDAAAQRPGMVQGSDDLATADLLKQVPGSLGPTSLGLLRTLDMRLDVLPLDGMAPSLDNLQSGRYPWRKTITVVLPTRPAALAERFVAFLNGPEAAAVLRRYDYLPEKQ
jgi:phosphate transport system substrate-binding protein